MKKFSKKKIIIFAIIAIIVAFIAFKFFGPKPEMTTPVEVSTLEKGNVESVVEVQGNVSSEDSAEITSPYNYEVVKINVKEGDTVQKGQVLAELDGEALRDEITLLQNEIKFDQQKLGESYDSVNDIYKSTESLKLNSENAKIALDNATKALDDKKQLLDSGAIPKQEYDNAKTALEQAQISYDNAQEALKKGEHDIQAQINQATPKQSALTALENKKISLSQKLEKLEKLKITSPIQGTVTRVYAKIGRYAQDTENHKPMFIIEDESKKYVVAKVGEYDISKIKLNQEVKISADVLGKDTVSGVVNRISPTGEKSSSSNSIIVPVKILVTQKDERLISGVNAKATIKIQGVNNVFKVPFDSILTVEDKNYIFTVENDTLKKIEVTKGLESDLETEISSPQLTEGMQIVKSPQETFMDGQKVQIVDNSMMMQYGAQPQEQVAK
ncbi:HlyD family secretion protein [Peptoanaerobacter stomatis]|uniref:HlyD family secretion protein n=1 Tax=Peptoanaerobacter stomatis TaxID=796937 RepID=J6HRA7_9FIRM|nr:HlyD family efflux transporter periplasmic adaptor subunit [Peptoanaerobacter stomatis]EJU24643.1 HlyD family secretion protein [Peptoanaerobacter stomatis]NWO25849.1 efflux RND transporter periplasmic adaptor subunit [Peptostreptococcaceae bacterium oral taxon 081]